MSRLIGDLTGNIFEEADSGFGLVSQPKSYKRPLLSAEAQPRGASGFVGLQNQGMTCYLNSLLQTMFLTPELRAGLYQVPLQELGLNADEMQSEAAAGEPLGATPKEHEEAKQGQIDAGAAAMESLMGMGFPVDEVERALKKFHNDVQRAADWLLARACSGDKAELPDEDTDTYEDLPPLEAPGADDSSPLMGSEGLIVSMEMDKEPVEGPLTAVAQDAVDAFNKRLYDMDESGMEAEGLSSSQKSVNGANGSQEHGRGTQGGKHRETEDAEGEEGEEAAAAIGGDNTANTPAIAVPPKPKRRRRGLIIELQKAFAWLQAVDQKAISTEDLTRVFGWDGSEARVQHDVHELNRILFESVEFYLKGTQQESLVKDLYHGTLVNQVECLRCGAVSERHEEFSDIPVVVKGFSSLEESLAAAAKAEMLDGDNQYFCERCQAKVDAQRSQRFRSLPPLLTLPLCRFEYDWDRDERRKITTPFSFPLTLNLAPYMAPPSSDGQPANHDAAANGSAGAPGGPGGAALFDLLSVVIHSGSAHSGHYHAYIRDMLNEGKGRPEGPTAGQDISCGFDVAAGLEGQVRGGMLYEGAGFNEGLEQAGSAMHALVEAAVQESGRDAAAGTPHQDGQGVTDQPGEPSAGSSPADAAEGMDEPDYGNWYDFNDSNVSVVHWSAITSQFGGGNECAYMLTYRARLPPGQLLAPPALAAIAHEAHECGEAGPLAANGTSHAGGVVATVGGPSGEASLPDVAHRALAVPGHLAPLVHKKNEQLREERRIAEETAAKEAAEAEAARAANQVRLFVHVPDDGYVRSGYLYSRHEDLSDVGRFLVLERSSTVGQLSVMVRNWCSLPAPELALYIVSPKIDTQEFDEPADEQVPAAAGFGGLVDWREERGGPGKEAESVTEDIVLDEDGEGVDKQANGAADGGTLEEDMGVDGATPEVSIVAKGESEPLAGTPIRDGEGLNGRGLEGAQGAYPPQRRLTDVFEGVAQNGDERAGARDGARGVDRVGTSSSGSSADSRSRGVKRAAEGGELQSRGKFQPEIIRGPQLLEFREPTEPQTSSESERRSAGAGEGPAAAEGSGVSLSGSGGAGLAEGLSGVNLARQADGDGGSMQEAPCLLVEQPRTKKVRRTIYEIQGRLTMRDSAQKLGEQIQNGGGVLAWSNVNLPPHGLDFLEAEDTTPMEDGGGVGQGWTSSVDNGWDVQPSGWGSPPRSTPLFTVKVYIHLDPDASVCLESFPVEANTSVWMLKSEALKRYRAHAHEALGEDDVVLCCQAAAGGPGETFDDSALVVQAGITDQQEVWVQRRSAAPSSSSVLRLSMTVYGKDGMAAAQLPIEMPRAALLVELVVNASERGAAAIRDHAAAIGAEAPQEPQLVVWRDQAFGGKKALNVDQDALRTLEALGFEDGDQLLVEDQDAVSPETVTVRVQRYVLPHDRDADEPCAKFLAATMAATSNLHGPPEAPPAAGDAAHDQQAIAAQANSLAAIFTAELAKRKSAGAKAARGGVPQRGAGVPPPRLGAGLGRGLGAGLSRSRARLKELAPGVHAAAPPGRTAPQAGGEQDGGGRGPAPLQSPYSAVASTDVDGSPPSRLPKRLQRTGSSTAEREQDAAALRADAGGAAARSAVSSPMRFQQAGVPEWCFWPVDEVVLPKSATLADLKRRILALPAFKRARGAGALPALTGLRVREVRGAPEAPQLGREYRDLDTDLAQMGVAEGQHLAARILPPNEEAPLSDCDSLPELVDYTEDDGSGGSGAATHAHQAPETAMAEASADLDLGEAAAGFGAGGAGLELPTSSGSGTSGGARGRAGPRLERGSTSMEVAVGDDPGDEVDSSAGLPDPGDLHQPLADAHPAHHHRSSPPPPRRLRTGPSRHALVLTVQRRVPLPPPQIPPVPVTLARRAVQALGPASRDAATASAGLPLTDASVNVRASPPPSSLVSPYFQAAASSAGAEPGAASSEARPSQSGVAGSVLLPSPVPETILLPQYLTGPLGAPAGDSGSGLRPPARSLPLSDASLGFMPLAKKSPTAAAYSSPAGPMQLSIPEPPELASWGARASPVHPPSTPANAASAPTPSREAQTGMQVLFRVASHLQAHTGATPANLHFLQRHAPDTAPPGFSPTSPNGLASPPLVKRQFVFTSPEEVALDTGRAVLTAAELKAVLAAHFGISAGALRVIKVDAAKLKVLPEDDTPGTKAGQGAHDRLNGDAAPSLDGGPGLGKTGKGKGATGKPGFRPSNASLGASVNLKGRPFQLRDGDTIVVMDAAEDPEQEDPWCADSLGPGVGSRVKLGPAPLNTTWEGSGYHKGPSIGPTEKKQRRPEATLRIRMDEYD